MNYYNEFDDKAAAWLQELINAKLIPNGKIDTRSIRDVQPNDLAGFTQCHFFAGIGGWSRALELAGWPESRPVWTGSCPCQPFSCAGKGLGQADERHLWPAFFSLIKECQPDCVFGEQVEGAIGKGWLDGICADLEGEGYTCGAAVLGAHSVGAPHIRQRLYWVAYSDSGRLVEFGQRNGNAAQPGKCPSQRDNDGGCDSVSGVAVAQYPVGWEVDEHRENGRNGQDTGRQEAHGKFGTRLQVQRMAYAESVRRQQQPVRQPAGVFGAQAEPSECLQPASGHGAGAGGGLADNECAGRQGRLRGGAE